MITLLHPSYNRPGLALDNYHNWIKKSSGKNVIEHILSLDDSDPQLEEYKRLFTNTTTRIIVNPNTCVVEAANAGAKEMSPLSICTIYLSDDFDCPENWDISVIERMSGKELVMLRVNDELQPMDNCVLTIPMMTRGLYEKLGYFFNPLYKSMWVDCDLYFVTKPYMVEAPDLHFRHRHQEHGNDETYQRSSAHWNQGVDVFNKRSAEFGWGKAFNRLP